MHIFHSGDGFGWAQPEILLGDEACIMLTYADQRGREPDPRFREIFRVRKEAREKKEKEKQDGKPE